ncbi:MAG TPA: hypothetical protein PKE27_11750 [Povalibacter sp.]|uniref:hypothetical protein n=1 Tax=Povalibacter sp. TaxID=1962978 RepID=UPI002BBB2A83|nr:hypothetical protein [Povalibacter sp.]HMN45245.1 hypothetical protein [Povalibacter sp.]
MLGIVARVIAGTVLGVLFLCAFAFGMACDLLSRESTDRSKQRVRGTATRSAESLQRPFHLGGEQA